MKLKYYLRGLGIGVFVSVLIVGLASGRQKMTDEEIIARAKELGMVESMVLSNMNNPQQGSVSAGNGQVNSTEETEPEQTLPIESEPIESEPIESEPIESEPVESEPIETEPVESEPVETEPTETEPVETEPAETEPVETEPVETEPIETEPVETTPVGETVTITIRSGDSSVTVSKTLEAAGLVANASAYDRFLCENGYDRKIRVGSYEIPVGASEEEIAEIIAGR